MSTLYVDTINEKTSGNGIYIPGHVLQVKQTAKTDTFDTSSTSYVDVTDMSISITPSSTSSKIMVDVHIGMVDASDAAMIVYKIVRGSTDIAISDSGNGTQSSMAHTISSDRGNSLSMRFLDSPATTSATTYKLQMANLTGNTAQFNRRDSNGSAISTITVTEIGG